MGLQEGMSTPNREENTNIHHHCGAASGQASQSHQESEGTEGPHDRGQKINANFFCTKFLGDPSDHGRPHQKVRFPAAPVVGRNFLTPGHPGIRVRNVRGKSGPKSLFESVQTRCIVKGEAQKSPLFWRFSGGF